MMEGQLQPHVETRDYFTFHYTPAPRVNQQAWGPHPLVGVSHADFSKNGEREKLLYKIHI